ncbi:protein of unknown function [Legionella fallonii LLAP-10]|uniref:Uncharacterized protein n=1 Tax=Legionella fallonii LLAP-10 TaxID=1212491 RepID=A0A098G0Y3_9GAMM|nr:protein of unknown function [Legionella fallonii LLAP-10]
MRILFMALNERYPVKCAAFIRDLALKKSSSLCTTSIKQMLINTRYNHRVRILRTQADYENLLKIGLKHEN